MKIPSSPAPAVGRVHLTIRKGVAMKKRLLPMVLVCCLLSALLAAAAQADDIVAKGNCGAKGSSVQWAFDSEVILA